MGDSELVKQIVLSELDYLEIKNRADALEAKTSLTADEARILADYKKKLAHDEIVVGTWIASIEDKDFKDILKDERQDILDGILAEENVLLQAVIDKETEVVAKKVIKDEGPDGTKLDEIFEDDKEKSEKWIERKKALSNKRLSLLNTLKQRGDKTIWQP